MKNVNSKETLRQFKKEIASLIAVSKINSETANLYLNIAKKILNEKKYLKTKFSAGHLRRIKRVFALLDRVISISFKSMSETFFCALSGIFASSLNIVFDSIAEYAIFKRKKTKILQEISILFKL